MKRLFRSRNKRKREPTEESSRVEPVAYRSLAWNVLCHQLKPGKKYRILDLGPAVGQNVEFFSQFPCRIHIEDFYETLNSFDLLSPEDGFSYEAVFSYLLPYFKNARFDVILAWDLFNYLNREEFKYLILHLSQFSQNGTLLFSLLFTKKYIPETPHRFQILDSERLVYHVNSTVLRECPRYEQSDLDRLMPSFRICNSFLLRNGFKEYLFLYE